MFIKVTESIFRDWMNEFSFSHEALGLLFDFLEKCNSSENGEELDPVALNCRYTEASLRDIAKEYSLTIQDVVEIELDEEGEVVEDEIFEYGWETMTDEMLREVVEEYLKENTYLVGVTSEGTAVYEDF